MHVTIFSVPLVLVWDILSVQNNESLDLDTWLDIANVSRTNLQKRPEKPILLKRPPALAHAPTSTLQARSFLIQIVPRWLSKLLFTQCLLEQEQSRVVATNIVGPYGGVHPSAKE